MPPIRDTGLLAEAIGLVKRVSVGIVGAGLWGSVHAEALATSPYARVVGICDRDRAKAERLAEAWGARVYETVEELAADPAIDALTIATPDHLHREPIEVAARAGKAILVEKPLATTEDDLVAIEEAVRSAGIPIMVDFHTRWSPPMVAAREMIERGEIGDVVTMYYRLSDVIHVPKSMLSWSSESSVAWFLGAHSIDTLRWLSGAEVTRVYSVARQGVLEQMGYPVADGYQTTLEFENGVTAQMENMWILPDTNPSVNDIKVGIVGSTGIINMDLTHSQQFERYLASGADRPDILVKPRLRGKLQGFAVASIQDFAERLATGQPFLATLEDGLRVSRTILAMFRSAEARQPVEVRL